MRFYTPLYISLIYICTFSQSPQIVRKQVHVPLPILTCSFTNNYTISEVLLVYEGKNEGWGISPGDDRYVKDTRSMRLDHIWKEIPTQNYLLSPYEAKVIGKACNSFEKTLVLFENLLRNKKIGQCAYLDVYLSPFCKALFLMISTGYNNYSISPIISSIPDSLICKNFDSPITDTRIHAWLSRPEHILKLRIAAKELTYQTEKWRISKLENKNRDPLNDFSRDFILTYELFTKLYFNLPAQK